MNQSKYISIGIPFYNAEKYLEDAICSVLAQTHKFWELILVDDGSTDNSLDIAKKYAQSDSRIRVISDGLNKKLPTRLNQIIFESRYNYIARMDADDLISNDRLQKQIEVLLNNDMIDFTTTSCLTIGKNNEITGINIIKDYQMSPGMILEGSTNLLHASLLARKEWYLRNTYNENVILAEDFYLWLQAAIKNDLNYTVIEEPLYWYRVTENITVFKMINGYNAQINIIDTDYEGIITEENKNRIIKKFKIKKAIVISLDKLKLLKLLLLLRSKKCQPQDVEYYEKNILNIKAMRI